MNLVGSILRRAKRHPQRLPSDLSRIPPFSGENGAVPEADLVAARFDRTTATQVSRMIVILSTPRCGSTLLCELLHHAGLCTAHEYFQRDDYLPILARRWDAVGGDGRVDWRRYAAALERHRTTEQGVLGVNLHGSHLRQFAQALPHFSAAETEYVWLQRRDKLRQAVSFGIAKQTGQWSSEFKKNAEAAYDFGFFRARLRMIQEQEAMIGAFLALRSLDCDVVSYEDLVEDPRAIVGALFGADLDGDLAVDNHTLRKQGTATNDDFVRRLAADLFEGPAE